MPSRLRELRELLRLACDSGYRFMTVAQYAEAFAVEAPEQGDRVFVLRHDIDTDPITAGKMADIEASLGIQATFYLRRKTFTQALLDRLSATGMDIGYHYEEVADFIKANRITDPQKVWEALPQIQQHFLENLSELRRRFNLPLVTAASHGDWANRRLKINNHVLLADPVFRAKAEITLEAYDETFYRGLGFRSSDSDLPRLWRPASPRQAIQNGLSPIYVLLHPRQWNASPRFNIPENALRIGEALRYRITFPR